MSPLVARSEAIRSLRRQLVSNQQAQSLQQHVPTGLPALDSILPGGGLPTASIIEWISSHAGQLTASIALRSVCPMLNMPGCLAIIDERNEFHAAAAMAQGIPLSRLLLVRPSLSPAPRRSVNRRRLQRRSEALLSNEALWALEQTVRSAGVRVALCWMDRSSASVMRRLQLAVERSGVTLILIRPSSVLQQPSFADLRLLVSPLMRPVTRNGDQSLQAALQSTIQSTSTRTFSVRLLRSRHGLQHEGSAVLEQSDTLSS